MRNAANKYSKFGCFGLAILVGLLLICIVYLLCPRPELKSTLTYSKAYLDNNGELLRLTLADDERYRLYTPLDAIAEEIILASILYEDQYYYDHHGVDVFALVRAFWQSYIIRDRKIGASTITMQVARLRWGIASNTIGGKLHQIFRSLQLSRHYSKQEILELYLNLASYGRNIEGVAAASLVYFNKKPSELSLPEALTLAVIPQNPNKRNPTTKRGYQSLLSARDILRQRWMEYYPHDQRKNKYFDLPLQIRPPEKLPFLAPHFINYLENNNKSINQRQESREGIASYIDSTLDSKKQLAIESVLQSYIESRESEGINNASALLINYKTLSIEAMVGSANFYNDDIAGQVNGTAAKRSPGSALKPFVYALAMDKGLIHPLSLLKDSPRKYGGFTPENYDKQFLGPVLAKDALIQSRNVPAVDLQSQLIQQKNTSFYQLLVEGGVAGLKHESYYGLALALGGAEVTALELAALYAGLANGGRVSELQSLQVVKELGSAKNRLSKKAGSRKAILSAEASYLVLDMLKDNPIPDALDIALDHSLQNEVAWKTGTSWAFRDAWAVGVSGPYVLVVWVGNFDGKGNDRFIGRTAAAPLFFNILNAVYPPQGWRFLDAYPTWQMNLKRVQVCANTGDLNEVHCPDSKETWFIPGVSPIKVSNIYRSIPINIKTGLRACWHTEGETEMKVYQFWPSDFLAIFRQAGIALKTPPDYEPVLADRESGDCGIDQKSTAGQIPIITSPQTSVEYIVRMSSSEKNRIPLKATIDPDVKKVHWFIERQYIGTTAADSLLFWDAKPGSYQLNVVDDAGRSASKMVSVRRVQ